MPLEYFEYTQLLTIGILFAFAIREYFAWMKSKNEHKENQIYRNGGGYKEDIARINLNLTNHITEIEGKINNIKKEVGETKTDIKLIQKDIRDMLIKLTK